MSAAPLSPAEIRRIADAIESGELQERAATAALRGLVLPASRFAKQDALIFNCRLCYFVDRSDREAGREIEVGLNRYAASAWSRDQGAAACPERIVGKVQGAYWAILKACPRQPSAERIRKILSRHNEITGSV